MTFVVLVRDYKDYGPRLSQDWWQFDGMLRFRCAPDTRIIKTYTAKRYHRGFTFDRVHSNQTFERRYGSADIAIRISVTCDGDGKPSAVSGTTVYPLEDEYQLKDIKWNSNDTETAGVNLKTTKIDAGTFDNGRVYTTRLEPRIAKYSFFQNLRSSLLRRSSIRICGTPYVFAGSVESFMVSGIWENPSEQSGWCIPLIIEWVD